MRKRWLSRRALLLHLGLVVFAGGCAALTWWQTDRALSGNTLSWLYAVEWPAFAVLAGFAWWSAIHDDAEAIAAQKAALSPPPGRTIAPVDVIRRAEEEDPELAAYNRYLASLATSGKRKTWRHS